MIEKALAGPISLIVKTSTLRDYGVNDFSFLEDERAEVTQRNVVFIARGECAKHAQTIAGMFSQKLIISQKSSNILWVFKGLLDEMLDSVNFMMPPSADTF